MSSVRIGQYIIHEIELRISKDDIRARHLGLNLFFHSFISINMTICERLVARNGYDKPGLD